MSDRLKKQLFQLTKKGDLLALKDLVGKHPSIDLRDYWTDGITYSGNQKDSGLYMHYYEHGSEYFSLLHQAASYSGGNLELLKYFVREHNFDPCFGTKRGKLPETPLHIAARYGNLDAVKYFIEELHVDPCIGDKDGGTPLFWAAHGGRLSVVQYLVEEQQVDVSAKNKHQKLPLSMAVLYDHRDVIKYFLEECYNNVNVNILSGGFYLRGNDFSGGTVLHVALTESGLVHNTYSENHGLNLLKFLIEKLKCDPNTKNSKGETAIEFAKRCFPKGHVSITYLSNVLKDDQPPQIIEHPVDKTVLQDEEVVFTVSVQLPWKRSLTYQWMKDDKDITSESRMFFQGANTPSLHINAATSDYEGSYKCIVSNDRTRVSVISKTAQLKVVLPPRITTSPFDQTKMYGDQVSFTLTVTSNGTVTYQWHKDSELITPDTHPYCEGATTSTLKIKAVLTEYEGTYSCLVSNEAGSVESDSAQLAVVSPVASLFKPAKSGITDSSPRDLPPLGPPKVEHVGDSEKIITGADEGIKLKVPPQSEKDVSVKIQTFNPTTSEDLVELPPDTKFVSPIYEVSTTATKLSNVEASVEHYALLSSDKDNSDMRFLYSSELAPPYNFIPMQGGKFSAESNVGTISFSTPGRYAVGTSTERQERYTLYFIYPVPKLSEKCMYALFSASYNQHAFEKHLLQEMEQRFEQAKFWPSKSSVTLDKGSDGFELVPQDEPEKKGYLISPLSHESFKIPVNDLVDYTTFKDAAMCLPPSVLIYVEPCEPYPTDDLKCKLRVIGVSDEITFVLNVKAPRSPSVPSSSESFNSEEHPSSTKLESTDIDHIVKILSPHSGKWRAIGEKLGFKTHELGAIEADPETQSGGVNGFLNAMLCEWSKWPSTTHGVKHTKHATLESLESALKHPMVDLDEVARNLREDLEKAKQGVQVLVRKPTRNRIINSKQKIITDFEPMYEIPKDAMKNSATFQWDLTEIHERGINGEGIVIAVLDDGIYTEHIAFTDSFKRKRISTANAVPGEEKKSVSKCKPGAHGTMAAFIAGGETYSNVPWHCGVAPKASLLLIRIGEDRNYKMSAVIAALELLIKHREKGGESSLHVVSMSLGMPYNPDDENQRTIQSLILKLKSLDVICVASAGNYGAYKGGVLFPACSEDVISVGALSTMGHSKDTNAPAGIDVFAPGECIPFPSTKQKDGTVYESGSSCAAPAIAGLVALVMHYAQMCEDNPEIKGKYRTQLFITLKLFKKEMKGDSNVILEPRRFFDRGLVEFELQKLRKEIAALKNK